MQVESTLTAKSLRDEMRRQAARMGANRRAATQAAASNLLPELRARFRASVLATAATGSTKAHVPLRLGEPSTWEKPPSGWHEALGLVMGEYRASGFKANETWGGNEGLFAIVEWGDDAR